LATTYRAWPRRDRDGGGHGIGPALTYDSDVHPIERLRYVARAGSVPMGPLVRESAGALGAFADDPGALLMACRRLLDRRPASAPLVWLTARMLTGPDPVAEAWDAVELLERDPTAKELEFAIPTDARVLVIGAPETTGRALANRPDLTVLLVDGFGFGPAFGLDLDGAGCSVVDVPESGLGSAAADSDLVILETECMGPHEALAPPGSRAAAATAVEAGIPVWLVGGVGRLLPDRMWDGVLDRVDRGDPWDREHELVPLRLVDRVVTPVGPRRPDEAVRSIDCPVAPELFRR
jgi:hypothetical protein